MLKCSICGQTARKDGRPFEKQGQLNLHMYHCKMKNVSRETVQEEKPKEETCSHDLRLLNLRQPIEKKAYLQGYREVCVKCQELH